MKARDELVQRLALRRRGQLEGLSEAGYQELVRDVRSRPEDFVDSPAEEAFLMVCQALERHDAACVGEELLDDDAFFVARRRRMERLGSDCEAALARDPDCLDAQLLRLLAQDDDPDPALPALAELDARAWKQLSAAQLPASGDAWDDVLLRPMLRIRAAVVRTCLDSARYRRAARLGEEAFAVSPGDAQGLRHTCALCYARLEDEAALEALDVRFSRQGDSWQHLSRAILLYKLGRLAAARRALGGYTRLCEGGAYALIKPIMIDTYLPDRPETTPLSFEEATLAVHEADPVIVDVPDFVPWAQGQRDVWFAAQSFAERRDLDW